MATIKMADDATFEVLDEFINDENTLVTYKWLSRTNALHVNEAKSLLARYVAMRRSSGDGNLNVIYCVTGMKRQDDDSKSHHVFLVADDKLDAIRDSLTEVTTCHVYSVQKTKLKDSNALYIADFDKLRENIATSNRYSAVQNPRAEYRTESEIVDRKPTIVQHIKQEKETVPSKKPEFFATKKQQSSKAKSESKKSTKGKSKQNSLTFTTGKKQSQSQSPPSSDPSTVTGKGKKTPRGDDDDDVRNTKRRKVKLVESSSEEEEEGSHSPVPSPPPAPRIPTPEPEDVVMETTPEPDDVAMETAEKKIEKPAEKENIHDSNHNASTKTKRRIRKKKLVPKTFTDEEGFMVTEKVWESDSTDASDSEEVKPKPAAPPPAKKPKEPPRAEKGKGKKTAPAPHKKQASLMNFFSKK